MQTSHKLSRIFVALAALIVFSLAALQQDWWDEWVCRWGGGVPIDG